MTNREEIIIDASSLSGTMQDPKLSNFYNNLEARILWLDTDVDEDVFELEKYIVMWNIEDFLIPVEQRLPIRLMFFSPGGDLDVNNAMIDAITLSKTPVYGYNMGVAYSAACYIYMACHKRFAMPNSKFLIHAGSCELGGDYNNISSFMLEYNGTMRALKQFVVEHSSITQDLVDEKFVGDWYVSAKDAHEEYGFVDHIITSLDDIAIGIAACQKQATE